MTGETNAGITPPLRELLKKSLFQGVEGTPLSPEKQPPLPPLVRGARKNKSPLPAAGVAFLYPPDKGG